MEALQTATPGVPIVGMTYYDPFLGLRGYSAGGHALAHADQRAWRIFNDAIATAYDDAGASVADVATTFRIKHFDHRVLVPGRGLDPGERRTHLSMDVVLLSKAHVRRPPEQTGYRKIARTFHRVLKPPSPT